MPEKNTLIDILNRPGSIRFDSNKSEVASLLEQPLRPTADNTGWFLNDRLRIKIYPTGHIAFYNKEGRRFLFTDPEGHPLHECEWGKDAKGETRLVLLRMQLDSQQWLGIKPAAKTFSTLLDLQNVPGGQSISLDDLRQKAATAWKVPFSEVKYFYRDENFANLGDGKFEIHLTKDGLYALPDGSFDKPLFLSWMCSLNWATLDLIPVVELFQSALPGSGGAVFEFIWGLFDDQSRDTPLAPLRYRGLPTYPSKEAFNIFSAFFIPSGPQGEDIMEVFMDSNRSHEITWVPRKDPPWRYFSDPHRVCVTVQDHFLYKVTALNDPMAIPYINCSRGARASCQRQVQVQKDSILLLDDENSREIPLDISWQAKSERIAPQPKYPFSWKRFFNGEPPQADPVKAIFTLPFYPEGEALIEESSLQPMVLDQIFYYMEICPGMPEKLKKFDRVLIHTFDAVISGCIDCTHERDYTVLYGDAEFARKNAQLLWDYAASRNQLDALKRVRFLPENESVESAYREKYDMIFKWIPFVYYPEREICEQILQSLVNALNPGGILFLAGPEPIGGLFNYYGLNIRYSDPLVDMPFFQQHLRMCPENKAPADLAVFLAEKRSS